MPVVTGLYTLLLPLVAFAALGSSRYLVVAADSATAAILAGQLSHMAPVASERYVALAGLRGAADGRLSAARAALSPRLPRGLSLADGARRASSPASASRSASPCWARCSALAVTAIAPSPSWRRSCARPPGRLHLPTLGVSVAVVALGARLPRARADVSPGALFAVVGCDRRERRLRLRRARHRRHRPGAGRAAAARYLPELHWGDVVALLPVAASCFLMIVAQSAATARAYAARHGERARRERGPRRARRRRTRRRRSAARSS